MPDVTRLLEAAQAGDRRAAADLLPLVYDELRQLAAARMAAAPPDALLDAAALGHEAYLRLGRGAAFGSDGLFLRAAAVAMRRVLIDHARRRRADKRGGGRTRVPVGDPAGPADPPVDLLALDDALTRFAAEEPRKAELVTLRYFAGLSVPQAAAALGVSVPTAE